MNTRVTDLMWFYIGDFVVFYELKHATLNYGAWFEFLQNSSAMKYK